MTLDPVEETIQTYNSVTEEYQTTHGRVDQIQSLLNFFIENLSGNKEILDLGCGTGRDARYFTERGLKVTAVDLSEKMLQTAAVFAPKANFILMDMRRLTFSDEMFDGVWAMASFLHIPKKEAATTLYEIHRVVKPGGIVLLSVKKGEGERYISKDYYASFRKYFSFYEATELEDIVQKAGFDIIKVTHSSPSHAEFINLFARKALKAVA